MHDDLSRLQTANCGSTWGQSYSFDPFGNIDKSVLSGSTGNSWQPTYTHGSTNTDQYFSLPGFTPTYDANGNLLTDSFHTYTWDAEGKMLSLDSTTLTYDAFGRMVEQNQSGTYFQLVYSPTGKKLAVTKAQVIQQAFVPLPGKAKAEYLSWGLSHYRHPDWLGSARLESSTTHTIVQDTAYDPFGVPYSELSGGNGEISFTEQNKDTAWLQYDFRDRQYDPNQGRWLSPDPTGLKAVDFTSPQTWNRYAYVQNNPLALVDPFGDGDGCYSMGDASCGGMYFGGGAYQTDPNGAYLGVYPSSTPKGMVNFGLQNGPGEFGATPGAYTPGKDLSAIPTWYLSEIYGCANVTCSDAPAVLQQYAATYKELVPELDPTTGKPAKDPNGNDILVPVTTGYLNIGGTGFPPLQSLPGPQPWMQQVGQTCAQAANAIQAYIRQHPNMPIPESLLLASQTCGQQPE